MNLSNYLKEYETNFKKISQLRDDLTKTIKQIQGDSGLILEKQNKLVDISVEIQ